MATGTDKLRREKIVEQKWHFPRGPRATLRGIGSPVPLVDDFREFVAECDRLGVDGDEGVTVSSVEHFFLVVVREDVKDLSEGPGEVRVVVDCAED